MPIKPTLLIKNEDWSKVFMKVHMDRNLEESDADRATILLANPYGKLTGRFTRGDLVKLSVTNIVRTCPKSSNEKTSLMFTGNIYTIQDGPRLIEIVATCKITSLSKNLPSGFQAPEGAPIYEVVQQIIDEFNKNAAEWEKIEVAEIWPCEVRKDQFVRDLDTTYLDLLDQCCDFSGGFYHFDDEGKFHFCEPEKETTQKTIDITPVSTNPVACYTQIGYCNTQTVIGTSENDPGHSPCEQDRHAPVMATYVSPGADPNAKENEGKRSDELEAQVVASPLYLPYVTTEAEALQIAKNMVKNYAQYKNATQDLELVNAIIKPLDHVAYSTGLRYVKGEVCSKIIPTGKHGKTEGLVRRAVCDISVKGWRQKLETCAPPSTEEDNSQDLENSPAVEDNVETASPKAKTYGKPPYGWTKDGYKFFFAEQSLYDRMAKELENRGIPEEPNSWMYVNPDAFNPNAPSRSWLIYRYGQDDVPAAGMKMVQPWNTQAAPGDIDGNNALIRG